MYATTYRIIVYLYNCNSYSSNYFLGVRTPKCGRYAEAATLCMSQAARRMESERDYSLPTIQPGAVLNGL